ncbi:MAG: NYN domain-containing protein [Angelakisella sp.]
MDNDKKFAVLIDADNISQKYIKKILDELPKDAIATYRHIFGDWTSPYLGSWKKVLLDHSFTPIQQYSYTTGKNSTDSAMIIDAMDILYANKVDGFCLVSSDGDYTRLAARLRESGVIVIGMGETKTPAPFINACNQFKYLDRLTATDTPNSVDKEESIIEISELQNTLEEIIAAMQNIVDNNSDEDGWMSLAEVGGIIAKRFPDFDVRNYGYTKLTLFVKSTDKFDIKSETIPRTFAKSVFIRNKGGNL